MRISDPTFAAACDVVAELQPSGSPVARSEHGNETVTLAWRRWSSYERRHKRTDSDGQVEDLAKGLRDRFEDEPRLTGPLMEDYRHLASALAAVFNRGKGIGS